MSDEELAQRACLLARDMLKDAARYLYHTDIAELNDVMIEAEKRGWYK